MAQVAVEQKKTQSVKQRNKLLKYAGAAAVIVLAAIVFSQCGGSNGGGSSDTTVASVTTAASNAATTTVPKFASAKLATKPVITVPAGTPPKDLQIKDLEVGTGATVELGDTVYVQYAGNGWATKKQFDASWDNGANPFAVENVGSAAVITGWNKGLIGMKAGGRRQLIIPPDLAYGKEARGDNIKANDTLVFVIDAVRVIKAAEVAKNTPTIAQ